MNSSRGREYLFGFGTSFKIALFLVVAVLLWAAGAPYLNFVNASNVSNFSDTLSSSAPSTLASSTLQFTLANNIVPSQTGQTLIVQLDPSPGASAFSEAYSTASSSQIYFSAAGTDYDIVTSCTAGNQVTIVGNYNGGSDENLTFTFCSAGASIATSTVVTIGVGPLWTNPSGAGSSYVIRLAGTTLNTGDTRVAIVNTVTVTAAVDTTFTFTVTGVATSTQLANTGTTTTRTSTPTALNFGTLVPNTPVVLAQQLTVSTNANNGFVVTVHEDQDPTSGTGAKIHLFKDGARTGTPTAWTAPTNSLTASTTWGHFGVTSDDSDLNSSEFVPGGNNNNFAGNFFATTTRTVFSHNGPADGATQDKGLAKVGYAMQVGSLQPAGSDYTNTLTYVATPTF